MLTFEGDRDFNLPAPQLWSKLRDAGFLADCIPDGSIEGTPERDRARCSVRPGFAFIRGTLDVNLDILEAVEPSSVKIQLASKGIGTSSDVLINLTIQPQESGSRIHYLAEVTRLGGLLKAVPSGLIRGAAQKIIEQVWENVGKQINA